MGSIVSLAATAAAGAIPPPLDQWLKPGISDDEPGRMSILSTIEALEVQAEAITNGADTIGITIA